MSRNLKWFAYRMKKHPGTAIHTVKPLEKPSKQRGRPDPLLEERARVCLECDRAVCALDCGKRCKRMREFRREAAKLREAQNGKVYDKGGSGSLHAG